MHPVPEAGPCIAAFLHHPLQQCANVVVQCNALCTSMQTMHTALHSAALHSLHASALCTVQGSQCIIRLPHLASETPAGGRALVCELLIIVKVSLNCIHHTFHTFSRFQRIITIQIPFFARGECSPYKATFNITKEDVFLKVSNLQFQVY